MRKSLFKKTNIPTFIFGRVHKIFHIPTEVGKKIDDRSVVHLD